MLTHFKKFRYLIFLFVLFIAAPVFGATQTIQLDSGVGDQLSDINWTTVQGWVDGGDVVYVQLKRGSNFSGAEVIEASGVSGRPITIEAYGTGVDPIITGGAYAFSITSRSYINIDHVRFVNQTGSGAGGIKLNNVGNINVTNCYFTSPYPDSAEGVRISTGNGTSTDILIQSCEFNNVDEGVYITYYGDGSTGYHLDGLTVDSCTFDNFRNGIHNWHQYTAGGDYEAQDSNGARTTNVTITNNTFNDADNAAIIMNPKGGVSLISGNHTTNIGNGTAKANVLQIGHATNLTIEKNYINGCDALSTDAHGIILDHYPSGHTDNDCDGVIVRWNWIINVNDIASARGIRVWDSKNAKVYGNVLVNNNGAIGVAKAGNTGNVFYNNTMIQTSGSCVFLDGGDYDLTETTTWKNNICVGGSYFFNKSSSGTVIEDHNLYYDVTFSNVLSPDGTDINDNPDFNEDEYTLSDSSPAIDTGSDLGDDDGIIVWDGPDTTTDGQDDNGAGWEIGAYLYVNNFLYSNAIPQGIGISRETGLSGTKPSGQTDTDWYFKAGSTPCSFIEGNIVASGDIDSVSNPILGGELTADTDYCWQIVVNPDSDNVTSGPYYFTTTGGPPSSPTNFRMIRQSSAAGTLAQSSSAGRIIGTQSDAVYEPPISGVLRVSSTNPRYFSDGVDTAIYMTGSHNWDTLVDRNDGEPELGMLEFLNYMQAHNQNFTKVWAYDEVWTYGTARSVTPYVYQRTGPGTATDDGAKFDLTEYESDYIDALTDLIEAAATRGIYVSIMLFEGWGLGSDDAADYWYGHPYNPLNNINELTVTAATVHDATSGTVATLQENYIKNVIDNVNGYDNIMFEISNEDSGSTTAWQIHMMDLIRTYEAGKAKQHLVLLTTRTGYPVDDSWITGSSADAFSPGVTVTWANRASDPYLINPPVTDGSQIVLLDTDHFLGGSEEFDFVRMIWKGFMRGYNMIVMDPHDYSDSDWELDPDIVDATTRTMFYGSKIDLDNMTPTDDSDDCTTTYCLRYVGNEYLFYQPGTGAFTADVSAGTYDYEWYNPSTGAVASSGSVVCAGGNKEFTPPFSGVAVLYLSK